jgi:predicted phosphodiesterase
MRNEVDRNALCERVEKILEREPRLIRLPPKGRAIFVGDTHGDLEATEKVLHRYLKNPNRIVFLGDYVDRGSHSGENLECLLSAKVEHSEEIHLLAGNHEGFMVNPFRPANFWESLSEEERRVYGRIFSKFPLAGTAENGILAVHGGLPDLGSLEEIDQIVWGDENWTRITWGDFVEDEGEVLGSWGGRPQFGGRYFGRMMERFQKKVLIRSHQPHSPQRMFQDRCITIFTSHAYLPTRTVALVDLEREVDSAENIVLERI